MTRTICTHEARTHAHGLCSPCYWRHRKHAIAQGQWHVSRVDAAEARSRIHQLIGDGLTRRRIADITGLGVHTIHDIASGDRKRIDERTARRILTVRPEDHPPTGQVLISPVGARRRIQALHALGWTMKAIREEVGISKGALHELALGKRQTVEAGTDAAIRAAYKRLEMKPGPSDLARARAKELGWVVPLLWNEGAIDDPDATPSLYAWDRYQGGHKVVV